MKKCSSRFMSTSIPRRSGRPLRSICGRAISRPTVPCHDRSFPPGTVGCGGGVPAGGGGLGCPGAGGGGGGVPAGGRDLGCPAAGEALPAVLQLGKTLDVIRLAEGDLDTLTLG